MWFTASGVLEFDTAPKLKLKKEPIKTLIVKLDSDDLDVYYQWFISSKFGQGMALQRPLFGTHISVVRRQEVMEEEPLGLLHGTLVSFEYSIDVQKTYQFWSLPVRSHELNLIRINYGLLAVDNLHITIGRQYDWQGD